MSVRDEIETLLDRLSEAELLEHYECLRQFVGAKVEMAPLPTGWGETLTGEPMPNVVAAVRRSRSWH